MIGIFSKFRIIYLHKTCSSSGIIVEYENVPAGYRPLLMHIFLPENVEQYTLTYANEYTCKMAILWLIHSP